MNHERRNLCTIYPYSIGGSERANTYSYVEHATTPFQMHQSRTTYPHKFDSYRIGGAERANRYKSCIHATTPFQHFKCMNHERQHLCTIYPYSIGGSERANNYMSSMQQRHSICMNHSRKFYSYRIGGAERANRYMSCMQQRNFKCMNHNSIIPHRWHRTCK